MVGNIVGEKEKKRWNFPTFIKHLCKNYKLVITVFVIIAFAFPFVLNRLVMLKLDYPVAGNPETWIAFWPSYLSAIASFGMIVLTAIALYFNNKTLSNNKEQLNELKRQWEEEHKPTISVSYNMIDSVAYLRLVNTSKSEIHNLNISGDFYVNGEKNEYFDLSILKQFNIDIESHGIRNIIIHPHIEPISNNCYFILNLKSDNMEERNIKVYCNSVYSIGDDIVWCKMIDAINRIHK